MLKQSQHMLSTSFLGSARKLGVLHVQLRVWSTGTLWLCSSMRPAWTSDLRLFPTLQACSSCRLTCNPDLDMQNRFADLAIFHGTCCHDKIGTRIQSHLHSAQFCPPDDTEGRGVWGRGVWGRGLWFIVLPINTHELPFDVCLSG